MPHTLTKKSYAALAQVRYEIRRFLTFSEGMARAAGIEPQQHQLLLALMGLPQEMRPTVAALAERLQIRHHSAVELVSRSVERGLVRRTRSQDDRREVILVITPTGERLLAALSRAHREELRSAAPVLVRALEELIALEDRSDSHSATRLKEEHGQVAAHTRDRSQ
jgi:DNA-binding MarR family transcriptional regulator